MKTSLIIMVGLVLAMGIVAFRTHGWSGVSNGLLQGARTLQTVGPIMLLGIALAGLIQVVVPPQLIAQWIGEGSGLTGVLIGTAAGALTPGGPFVIFPIMASLFRSGAGAGPLVAYVTAWGLIPLNRVLVWELPFMGYGFALPRHVLSFLFPIVAGLLAPYLFALLARFSNAAE